MTSKLKARILVGSDLETEIPDVSFGKLLFDNLRKNGSDTVLINPKNNTSLTCEQLIEGSVKLANRFKKDGLSEGDVIAVVCQNRIDYLIPLLSSAYLGILAQPMTSHLTLRELTGLIKISQPKWLFCCNETLAKCVQLKEEFTCIEELISFEPSTMKIKTLEELLQDECDVSQFKPEDIPADSVAYLLNSSGTSGVPKCVMLTHRNMVSAAFLSRYFLKMSSKSEARILVGDGLESEMLNIGIGKFVYDSLKKEKQNVVMINPKNNISMTCEELIQRSVKIANCFKNGGLKEGDVIGVVCENRADYMVPLLGSSYLGIIGQPMSSHLTLRELSELIKISQPKWLFSCNKTLEKCIQLKEQFPYIEEIISFEPSAKEIKTLDELLQVECDVEQFEPEDISGDKVAYLFNSSGTSGMPKCVMITHKNMVFATIFARITFRFKKNDVCLSPLPLSHIYGFTCYLSAIVASTKYVVMDRFTPDLYLKYIDVYQANKLSCPPALVKFLVESPLTEEYDLSSIQEILYGSAPLPEKIQIAFREKFNNVQLQEGCGLTETTSAYVYGPKTYDKPGSCGRLLPSMIAKVICPETNKLLAPHQPGEICIKGPTVMKGYMGNIEASANAFDEEGYFKTGDVGYYDEDEYIYIVDRIKELIKYKGFQVSPTELELIINQHPAVKEACVIGVPDERCGEIPVAYVILKDGKTACEKEIADLVAANVNYTKWLYGGVKFVQEIPKSATGKHKRQELRKLQVKNLSHSMTEKN